MRTISGNSAGSRVGSRNRWASTAITGRLNTTSSSAFKSGTTSSSVGSIRTSQAPLRTDERKRFQPCAVGVMNTDVDAASILKLLPGDQLGTDANSAENHLDNARGLTGPSHADNTIC